MRRLRRIPVWLAIVLLLVGWQAIQFSLYYVTALQQQIVALDANTGQVLWVRAGDFAGNLVADDDRVFGQTLRKTGPDSFHWNLVAIDAKTGETQWQSSPQTLSNKYSAVSPLYIQADSLYYAAAAREKQPEKLIALEVATGKLRWQIDRVWSSFEVVNSGLSAIARGDRLIFLNQARGNKINLQAVNTLSAEPIWQVNLDALDSLNAIYDSSFAISDRAVFFKDYRGVIHAFDLATGQLQFTIPLEDGVDREIQIVDDRLYGRIDSVIVAFDGTTRKERWRRGGTLEEYSRCNQQNPRLGQFRAIAESVYATCKDTQGSWLMALNATNGQRQWLKRISPAQRSLNESSRSERLQADRSKTVLVTLESATEIDANRVVALAAENGVERWRFAWNYRYSDLSPAVVSGNRIFILDKAPRWHNWIARFYPNWSYGE